MSFRSLMTTSVPVFLMRKKMKAWKLLHCFNVMNLISDTACVIWFLKKCKWSKDSQKRPIMNHTHYIAEVITEMKPLIDFWWFSYWYFLCQIFCVFLLLIKPMSVQGVKNTYNHIPQNIYIPSWSAQLFLHSCLHVGLW